MAPQLHASLIPALDALLHGADPVAEGEYLDSGMNKAAYVFLGAVVKENDSYGPPPTAAKLTEWLGVPARPAAQFHLADENGYGGLLVQERVTPLKDIPEEAWPVSQAQLWNCPADIHAGNVGLDADGMLVVFDW